MKTEITNNPYQCTRLILTLALVLAFAFNATACSEDPVDEDVSGEDSVSEDTSDEDTADEDTSGEDSVDEDMSGEDSVDDADSKPMIDVQDYEVVISEICPPRDAAYGPGPCTLDLSELSEVQLATIVRSCEPGEFRIDADTEMGSQFSLYRSGALGCAVLVRLTFPEGGGLGEVWTCESLDELELPIEVDISGMLYETRAFLNDNCVSEAARQNADFDRGLVNSEVCRGASVFICNAGYFCDTLTPTTECSPDNEFFCQPFGDLCDETSGSADSERVRTCGGFNYESRCAARQAGAIGPLIPAPVSE